MPIGFPPTPTTGQQFPIVSPKWEWDGTKWRALSTLGSGATPITARLTTLAGTDDVIALRASVPHLASLAAIATYTGGSPAATAPAALTVGQWSAEPTATPGEIGINIATLPSDGGSAITALEYRVGTGAAVALTGTGTGLRVVTAGFTAGVAAAIQVRAVNAVDADPANWSDVKTRTPAAAGGGGGGAEYIGQSVATGTDTIAIAIPGGVTASDTVFALLLPDQNSGSTGLATLEAPSGWTAHDGVTVFEYGARLFSAPGNVGTLSFTGPRLRSVVVIGVTGSYRDSAMAFRYWNDGGEVHTSPAVTAGSADLSIAVYAQLDSDAPTHGAPTSGYAEEYLRADALPFVRIVSQSDVLAGSTGAISLGGGANYSTRVLLTLAVQS
jgi:hypothetical protein